MKIDLSQLNQDDTLSIHLNEASADETIPAACPIEVMADIVKSGEDIIVRGTVTVDLQYDCSRCLKRCICKVNAPFEAHFMVPQTVDPQEIDLWDDIRETIVLSMPEKPLCREDCPGICSQCGKDLSEGPCRCGEIPCESPLSKLKYLIKGKKK